MENRGSERETELGQCLWIPVKDAIVAYDMDPSANKWVLWYTIIAAALRWLLVGSLCCFWRHLSAIRAVAKPGYCTSSFFAPSPYKKLYSSNTQSDRLAQQRDVVFFGFPSAQIRNRLTPSNF